ncbi:MAG: protein kinase [Elusimicrobia bacterium]|nr:protein kinase [Elusimicrobiota bacterium]
MRALAAFLLLSAPAWSDEASQQALARVRAAERAMKESQSTANEAAERKSSAAKRALDPKTKAESTPFMIFGIMKSMAEGKASNARGAYDEARRREAEATTAFVKDGSEYVQAEDAYKKATGDYYNPSQYEAVRDQISHASSGGGGLDEEEEVDPETAQKEAATLQKALKSGNLSSGELTAKGADLSKMGDSLIAQTLDSKFSAPAGGAAAYAVGAPHGEGAARSVGYGRAAPPPDALRDDKAILLRQPMENSRRTSSGRFASAGGDRLSGGDAAGALRAAESALKEDPKNAKAWVLKATALNRLKRFKEAEEAARRATELDKGDARAWRQLAWAQLHNGDAAGAEASATRMLFLDPENAEAYILRALAYEEQGMRDKMLADLEKAAALDPRFRNHLLRARAGYKLFDPENSDTEDLLGALAPPPVRKSNPMTWLGAFFFLMAALAVGARSLPAFLARLRERSARSKAAPPPTAGPAAPAQALAAAPGKALVGGKYRLDQVAGRGGMGRVWAAWDVTLDRQVALKEMAPELAGDPALRGLYLKEARTLAALHHPNIVEIYEILDLAPDVYLVFEWVAGKTLGQLLAEKGRLPLETARAVLAPVCEALANAHERGIVHRDLKPANIMVTGEGRVKLMDFGIARALAAPSPAASPADGPAGGADPLKAARTLTVAGTPAYRPPDAEEGLVTPAFDVFSLGVCLYESLTGKLPFGPTGCAPEGAAWTKVSALHPEVPEALDDILARAFEPRAEKRLKDARAFKGALLRV